MQLDNIRILFVGTEKQDGLEHVSSGFDDDWKVEFTETPAEAMQKLQSSPFDVVIADLEATLSDQVSLLEVVKSDFPQASRILLTEDSRATSALELIDIAHQQLPRPFDYETLKFVLRRATELNRLVDDPALRHVLANVNSLPNIPQLYTTITQELNSDDPSMRRIGELVTQDIGMTAKVLQVANSVLMGARVEIVDPIQATVQMGSDLVRSLVLGTKVFDHFDGASLGLSVPDLLNHSVRVGTFAQRICRQERVAREESDAAFTSGLLHDVGKLILATNLPDSYADCTQLAGERSVPLCVAEKEILGSTHAEVGAYLVGLWGLPDRVFHTMLDHHSPLNSGNRDFGALAAVHVANAFDYQCDPADEPDGAGKGLERVDLEYVEEIQATKHLTAWRDACLGPR